jgi:hypothetical protein
MPAIEIRGGPEGEDITVDAKDNLAQQWQARWQDEYEQVEFVVFAAPDIAMVIDQRLDTQSYQFGDLLDDVDGYNRLPRRTVKAVRIPPHKGEKAPQSLQEAHTIHRYQSYLEQQTPEVRTRRISQFEREYRKFFSPEEWESHKVAEIAKTDAYEQKRIFADAEKLRSWGYQL